MDAFDFQNLLHQRLKERGLTTKKLSEISGIAVKHVENLSAGRFENLPPSPYLRGYLIKIGEALGFNGEEWWEKFEEEKLLTKSGSSDELPKNRFARQPLRKNIWIAALVILFLLVGLRFSQISGRPTLTLISPLEETTKVSDDEFLIQGYISEGGELIINGEPVPVGEEGSWEKNILLYAGLNTIKIVAKKFLGGETEIIRQVIYEPGAAATSTP